jgi:hypothetical protein
MRAAGELHGARNCYSVLVETGQSCPFLDCQCRNRSELSFPGLVFYSVIQVRVVLSWIFIAIVETGQSYPFLDCYCQCRNRSDFVLSRIFIGSVETGQSCPFLDCYCQCKNRLELSFPGLLLSVLLIKAISARICFFPEMFAEPSTLPDSLKIKKIVRIFWEIIKLGLKKGFA